MQHRRLPVREKIDEKKVDKCSDYGRGRQTAAVEYSCL